jgi:hypothetical protein
MKVSNKRTYATGDFLLKFKPVSLTFSNPQSQSLKLYLEKSNSRLNSDVQIIG